MQASILAHFRSGVEESAREGLLSKSQKPKLYLRSLESSGAFPLVWRLFLIEERLWTCCLWSLLSIESLQFFLVCAATVNSEAVCGHNGLSAKSTFLMAFACVHYWGWHRRARCAIFAIVGGWKFFEASPNGSKRVITPSLESTQRTE